MAIWNLGSINADLIYSVPHLPQRGETLAATDLSRFLGGKGANMSVAAARAAARVKHIGSVGSDGRWAVERLLEYGVEIQHIREVDAPTGHAVIAVDQSGENSILLFPGANQRIAETQITAALADADHNDIFLLQNETNGQKLAAKTASELGLRVCFAAAPFDAGIVREMFPFLDLLVLNEVEAQQLESALGLGLADLGVDHVIVTMGADGCRHFDQKAASVEDFPAVPVTPVDTTGAGDTFTGYLVAGLDRGLPMKQSISQALVAAAIMVTRHGTADAIPDLKDLQDWKLG